VAHIASQGITNHYHSAVEIAEAHNAFLAIIFSIVFEFGKRALKYLDGAIKIEFSLDDGLESLLSIV
jgi:hypothetical protein